MNSKESHRCVQQCERWPRARCTGTRLYALCIQPGTSTSSARRALTLLNTPQTGLISPRALFDVYIASHSMLWVACGM